MTTKVASSMTVEAVTASSISSKADSSTVTTLDAANVKLTGNQTIAGTKTFSSQPTLPQAPTLMAAVASTSGTSVSFTGIPSWVKRITVMFYGVSTTGTSPMQIQFGTGATPTYATSGYASNCVVGLATVAATSSTTGLVVTTNAVATDLAYGNVVLNLVTGTAWSAAGLLTRSGSAGVHFSAGGGDPTAVVTAVRVTTVGGSDTFDAGSVAVLYE